MPFQVPSTYDALIKKTVEKRFPLLLNLLGPAAWLWIKAQVWQESAFNPNAVSPVGAVGLMQLMPGTDKWIDGDIDGKDPEGNLDNGVRYMEYLFGRFKEIPCHMDRLRIAQACYNGGPGYPNVALALARKSEGLPYGYQGWVKAGRLPGVWQTWAYSSAFLAHPECRCNGVRPDYIQITEYVERIGRKYEALLQYHFAPGAGQ